MVTEVEFQMTEKMTIYTGARKTIERAQRLLELICYS
jgi:hypothetical protein